LLARGRYGDAKCALDEVTQGDPLVIAVARARLWVGLGEGQEALSALDAVADSAAERAGTEAAQSWRVWKARALVAVARYPDALAILREMGPIDGPAGAEALAFEGVAHMHMGDEKAARDAIDRAVIQAQSLGDSRVEGVALACLGLVLQRSQTGIEAARQAYERALSCAQNAADAGTIGTVQLNLAVLLKVRGDVARAIEMYEAAVDMGRRSGRRGTVRTALLGLANADLYVGRLVRARTSIEALEQQRDSLGVVAEGQFFGLQAELFARLGDIPAAAKAYARCAEVREGIGRTVDAAEARLESVLVCSQGPEPDIEALSAELLRAKAQLVESHEHKALVCAATARVATLMGDEVAARAALEEGLVASREASQLEWTWQILAARAELAERSGQYLMARRDRLDAVTILEEIAARLPRDLREVFWNDGRRRALRSQVSLALGSAETQMAYAPVSRDTVSFGRSKISGLASTLLEQRLARILEINRELLGELDLDRLSRRVIEVAVELVRAERGFVILRGEDGALSVRSSSTREGDGDHQQFSRSIAERVLSSREPFVTTNARDDERMQEFSSVHKMLLESVACVPIIARFNEPIGALYVETRRKGSGGFQMEVPTLQAFADQVALAIETAHLVSENRHRAEELAVANEELRTAQASLKELLGERTEKLKLARQRLRETQDTLFGHFGYQGLVGTSERMRRCYSLIDRVKDTDVPILITGESGTGKEVAARALHRASERAKLPFLGVNCGAIPEHLLESELFGHVRGAFTGADRDRKGLLREAQGGIVLLDEIGEMPHKMQAGLLRVLQERKVRPVGGTAEEPVSCRFIFATHRNLLELVEAGKFREDLYYRIHVVELPLPALRDRLDDIPLLVDHFFGLFAARYKRERKTLTKAALRRLANYSWPGNVRQFEHTLLNAWVMTDEPEVDAEDLELPNEPRSSSVSLPAPTARESVREELAPESALEPPQESTEPARIQLRKETTSQHRRTEKERMIEALEACNWNRVKAAELSGIPRRTFYRRLREYNIQ
jgi:serine/threonine-protein kinase PknK